MKKIKGSCLCKNIVFEISTNVDTQSYVIVQCARNPMQNSVITPK